MKNASPNVNAEPITKCGCNTPVSLLSIHSLELFVQNERDEVLFPQLPSNYLLRTMNAITTAMIGRASTRPIPMNMIVCSIERASG